MRSDARQRKRHRRKMLFLSKQLPCRNAYETVLPEKSTGRIFEKYARLFVEGAFARRCCDA